MTAKKPLPVAQTRRRARHYAMQAIYGWQMAGGTAANIEASFRTEYDMSTSDIDFFRAIITAVMSKSAEYDQHLKAVVDRSLDAVNGVELALLRCAVFELAERIDVPYKVVINEYVALAKKFGATDSFKYINGVLDKVATTLRSVETGSQGLA